MIPRLGRYYVPTRKWIRGTACVAAAALVSTAFGGVAQSAPRRQPPEIIQGGAAALPDKDVRPGRLAPTTLQESRAGKATVRWNKLGTPALLTEHGAPLATGLAGDPERAARDYLKAHAEVFGL